MERKLASIQEITDIKNIDGYNKIKLATVLGWDVIINNDFSIGDKCIYIETDSILPERKEFEFLKSRCYSKKYNGYRIKTIKMAGVVSQGIIFNTSLVKGKIKIGRDVTKGLGVQKYDIENNIEFNKKKMNTLKSFLYKFWIFRKLIYKNKIHGFPKNLVEKTDETRIQAVPNIIEDYKGTHCFITEKLDGQSATYIKYKKNYLVCSRNCRVYDKNTNYWKIYNNKNIKLVLDKLAKLFDIKNIAIQGEIIGPGVQNGSGKNIYNLKELDFYIFNVIDIDKKNHLFSLDNYDAIRKVYKTVTIIDFTRIGDRTIKNYIDDANRISVLYNTPIEGIVIRESECKKMHIKNVGTTLSFKVINNEFLLKYKL